MIGTTVTSRFSLQIPLNILLFCAYMNNNNIYISYIIFKVYYLITNNFIKKCKQYYGVYITCRNKNLLDIVLQEFIECCKNHIIVIRIYIEIFNKFLNKFLSKTLINYFVSDELDRR